MGKEIEVKFLLDKEQRACMTSWLEAHATFVKTEHHTEYYLNKPATTFFFTAPEGYKDALDYLRVRLTEGGDSLCFKKFHEDPVEKRPLYCDEFEVSVSDGKETLELMGALGYTEQTLMEKVRNKYTFDCFEIVIDGVTGLGVFCEVELKKEVVNSRVGLKLIYDFLKSIGIMQLKLQTRGYVSMLWNPEFDFGKFISL